MRFIYLLKDKPKVLIICLVAVIIVVLGSIFYLNANALNNNSTASLGNGLKNYAAFKQKVNSLTSANKAFYLRLMEQFAVLEAKNTTAKNKYNALVKAADIVNKDYYGGTFNPAFYKLVTVDFIAFAKNNFSAFYNPHDFQITCQDPSCADSPMPKTISDIINEIKALNGVPEDEKSGAVGNLVNDSYVSGDNAAKVQSYFITAGIIRDDEAFIKAGVNTKIADEIEAFVKDTYPKDYYKPVPGVKQ
jgi:cell division protein FtsL